MRPEFNILHRQKRHAKGPAATDRNPTPHTRPVPGGLAAAKWPQRPPPDILSAEIPLFYVGQDNSGFWVARDADGRVGGIFLLRNSALRFAHRNTRPTGCATMFVSGRCDLDIKNRGNPFVGLIAAAKRALIRAVSKLLDYRTLHARFVRARAEMRDHRAAMERDLFGGRHKLSTKNDDDLSMIR